MPGYGLTINEKDAPGPGGGGGYDEE